MVVVKMKVEFLIKILLLFIFLIFLISNFFNKDLANNLTTIPRNGIYNVVITGGSNALYGLSAKKISINLGKTGNLSLPSEGGIFTSYLAWIKKINIKTNIVIYSPVSLWDIKELDKNSSTTTELIQELFPKISILRYLTNKFINNTISHEQDNNGDLVQFNCNNDFFEWKASNEYIKRAMVAANHFKQRLSDLRHATQADIAVLRIPPLYVSSMDKTQIELDIQAVIAYYRTQGIIILDEPFILSTDRTLFCDHAYHPSESGRDFFTQNFINSLKKQIGSQILN